VQAVQWDGAAGDGAVYLAGPAMGSGYRFEVRDAGAPGSVPVVYNGFAWTRSDTLLDSLTTLVASTLEQAPAEESAASVAASVADTMPARAGLQGPVVCPKPRALMCERE
jgi:hypothetical protein